jgi:TadE-like protein
VIWRRQRLRARGLRGQAMVETALILPILLLIVLGTLEFGFAFDHNLTLEYATREGARTGSALANGGGPLGCNSLAGQSPNAASVDPAIVAAVERVLTSHGSPVILDNVGEIHIFRADATGNETSDVNVWTYTPGTGPIVDGTPLDFTPDPSQQGWPACGRDNSGANPDFLGVSLSYTYHLQTPLGAFVNILNIGMHDRTVMQLNPTNK